MLIGAQKNNYNQIQNYQAMILNHIVDFHAVAFYGPWFVFMAQHNRFINKGIQIHA